MGRPLFAYQTLDVAHPSLSPPASHPTSALLAFAPLLEEKRSLCLTALIMEGQTLLIFHCLVLRIRNRTASNRIDVVYTMEYSVYINI